MRIEMKTSILVFIVLKWSLLSSFGIIVQFDGGMQRTHDSLRHAACTACIILEPNDDKMNLDTIDVGLDLALIKLGGKLVKSDMFSTSAEIEYEGLLFGLLGLLEFMEHYYNESSVQRTGSTITIQGDCKNVISQMNGLARPRKLESYHRKCQDLISCRSKYHIYFQHVPRQFNIVCDYLANQIILDQQKNHFNNVISNINLLNLQSKEVKQNLFPNMVNNLVEMLTHSKLKRHLCFCDRIRIYRWLLALHWNVESYAHLLTFIEVYQHEVDVDLKQLMHTRGQQGKAIPDHSFHDCKSVLSYNLLAESIRYQIASLRMLGREKEAKQRLKEAHRKYNFDPIELCYRPDMFGAPLYKSEDQKVIQFDKQVDSNNQNITDAVKLWIDLNLKSAANVDWASGVWWTVV